MASTSLEANINTHSRPTDLKITDLRIVNLEPLPFDVTLLRLDTNQGISGYGEVRDGASPTYALLLKSRLLGENPCNIDKLFRRIKQFGYHGRQGGGVCGIEMALFDLAGKAYGAPAYQLAGGKFRDKVLIYSDTDTVADGAAMGERLKRRMDDGFKFLKMDIGIGLLEGLEGAIAAPPGRARTAQHHASFHRHPAHRYRHRLPGRICTAGARNHRATRSRWRPITSGISMLNPASGWVRRWINSRSLGTKT